MSDRSMLPVAIIGAGPIGLAAAAHLIERKVPVKIYESGETIGAYIRDWSHVRIFTTWAQSVDPASCRLLRRHGWVSPPENALPTGGELYAQYLQPLAATSELAAVIETGARIVSVTRQGIDKVVSQDRAMRPFRLRVATQNGDQRDDLARAVIDASGTWGQPNPLGGSGIPAISEHDQRGRIAYGMPDVLGRDRSLYAGKRVAVIGSGYSAINVLLDLAQLAMHEPATKPTWITRSNNLARIYGGGRADQLPARGALGGRLQQLVAAGKITVVTGFSIEAVMADDDGVMLDGNSARGQRQVGAFDRLVAATGQRPDLTLTRELRLDLDPWLERIRALGPLIDPNLHSCGDVPPHGHREVSHPEPDFYTIGVKSYGRAPTFLLLTGYEQARSVAAILAGDQAAADQVDLVLPATGICSTNAPDSAASNCCGGPAIEIADACCVADEVAKTAGQRGCGCGVPV